MQFFCLLLQKPLYSTDATRERRQTTLKNPAITGASSDATGSMVPVVLPPVPAITGAGSGSGATTTLAW